MKFSVLSGPEQSDLGKSIKLTPKKRPDNKTQSPQREQEAVTLDFFETEMTTTQANSFKFSDQIQFLHSATLKELKSQTLCVELFASGSDGAAPIAEYLVNMFIIAIGPVHHGVELTST